MLRGTVGLHGFIMSLARTDGRCTACNRIHADSGRCLCREAARGCEQLVVESLRVKAVPTKKHRLLLAGANELKAKGASTLTVRLKAINVGAACLF
jgi:hypothetical protein